MGRRSDMELKSLTKAEKPSSGEKWAVSIEYDLEKGLAILARIGEGLDSPVAMFNTKEEAEKWVKDGNVDEDIFDVNYLKVVVD